MNNLQLAITVYDLEYLISIDALAILAVTPEKYEDTSVSKDSSICNAGYFLYLDCVFILVQVFQNST